MDPDPKLENRPLRPEAPFRGVIVRWVQPVVRAWILAYIRVKTGGPVPLSLIAYAFPRIHGTGKVTFGKNVVLRGEVYLESTGDGTITIEDGVELGHGAHLIAQAGIRVGRAAVVGEYASLRDALIPPCFPPGDTVKQHKLAPIVIGENVVLGSGVTVLPGVTVGDGAVVRSNSVVADDVPCGLVVRGIPARPE